MGMGFLKSTDVNRSSGPDELFIDARDVIRGRPSANITSWLAFMPLGNSVDVLATGNRVWRYMTDVGMTGPLESVIGVRTDIIVRRFLTELPAQFEVVL
jgi:hypothetical protein